MGSPIKFKPKLRLGERFGKGLGSVFNYLPPSMQLPLLKMMKKLHPVYADVFIRKLGDKLAWESDLPPQLQNIGYEDKAARKLRSWVFDNATHGTGKYPFNQTFHWPKLLDFTIREQNRKKPFNFIRAFDEDFLKYKETEDFKYDMALQDQNLEKRLEELAVLAEGAKIIPFKKPKKPKKNMGGIVSLIS